MSRQRWRRPMLAGVMLAAWVALAPAAIAQTPSDDDSVMDLKDFSAGFIACMGQSRDFAAQKLCMEQEARRQEMRLNGAYQALRRRQPGIADGLASVQRLWLQYRDSNCQLLAVLSPDRDKSTVVTMCRMNMSAQRATELEAMQP